MSENLIDCDAGRRLGCSTFCCRLVVRLAEFEREPTRDGSTAKGCIDKALDGLCIHLDPQTHHCMIWDRRPRVCREYTCNNDPMLQAAVHFGVKGIVQLSKDAQNFRVSNNNRIKVPSCNSLNEAPKTNE